MTKPKFTKYPSAWVQLNRHIERGLKIGSLYWCKIDGVWTEIESKNSQPFNWGCPPAENYMNDS